MMDPIKIIEEFYRPGSRVYDILVLHGKLVAQKALTIAKKVSHLKPDLEFIEEAALLHDIGMFLTDAPDICCTGRHPYIMHGFLGRELLNKKELPRHALVCERHVGVGITAKDIKNYKLPLPERDMRPVSIEEQIICFADKFFSKDQENPKEKTIDEVIVSINRYGKDKVEIFKSWLTLFGVV